MSDSFMSPGSVIKKCLSGRNVLSLDVHRKSRISKTWASLVVQLVKNLPATQIRDTVSIPSLRRSPGGGNGDLLQHSCLEKSMDRGAPWFTVQDVTRDTT